MTRATFQHRWTAVAAACLVPALLAGDPASAAIARVDGTSGADVVGCGSSAQPCGSIQFAVDQAVSGDEIRVAQGTYTHAGDPDCDAVVCVIAKKLTLRGGFAGGDWESSDPSANPTVIDGEDLRRGLEVIRGGPMGLDTRLVLEGFTVRRGFTSGAATENQGGGMRASNAELEMRDLIFEDNLARGVDTAASVGTPASGGGLHIANCPDVFPNATSVLMERIVFSGNSVQGGSGSQRGGFALGGGLFVQWAELDAFDLEFTGNTATAGSSAGSGSSGGATADGLGGAATLTFGTRTVLKGATVIGNTATGGDGVSFGGLGVGGGLFMEGRDETTNVPGCGAPTVSLVTELELVEAVLEQNVAAGGDGSGAGDGKGGAIGVFRALLEVDRARILANAATGGVGSPDDGAAAGGGVFIEHPDSTASLSNSVGADNTVTGEEPSGGGAIRYLGADGTLRHVTLARNSFTTSPIGLGQGLLVGPRAGASSTVTVAQSVIADHTDASNAAVHVLDDATVVFDRGLFAGNTQDTQGQGVISGLETVDSALSVGFASPGAPDFDYHLTAGSDAIDGAVGSEEASDIDGQGRNAVRDLGADEHCPFASDDLLLTSQVVTGSATEHACNTITASSYSVTTTGIADFTAGVAVILEGGFEVLEGGELSVLLGLP